MKSSLLVSDMEHCLICGKYAEEHHVFFGTANRGVSDKHRLVVPLCAEHHRTGNNAPHRNREIDLIYKCWAQRMYEDKIGSRDDFRKDFGKSYL